jgi:hypothetical protein
MQPWCAVTFLSTAAQTPIGHALDPQRLGGCPAVSRDVQHITGGQRGPTRAASTGTVGYSNRLESALIEASHRISALLTRNQGIDD